MSLDETQAAPARRAAEEKTEERRAPERSQRITWP